jgi:carbon monoxide dehydrogenase subunit G
MMFHLDGSTAIKAKRDRVFQMLTDPRFIATTLPDAVDVSVIDEDSLEAKMKVKISVVSSTMKVRLRISDRAPPSMAKLVAEGTGSGSNLKVNSTFNLEGDGTTTRLSWVADVEITGLMGGLGAVIIRGFAEKKVIEIFSGITKGIEKAG